MAVVSGIEYKRHALLFCHNITLISTAYTTKGARTSVPSLIHVTFSFSFMFLTTTSLNFPIKFLQGPVFNDKEKLQASRIAT